ncbi:MAG: HAD family hydrolase [Bacteroidales bacterium]|nr:HAD family hydrolase [Bacteroidales bacterium]
MHDFNALKKALKTDRTGWPTIKMALLGDTATQFLAIAIRGTAALRGLNIDLFEAEYNQVERQLMDPQSDYYQFAPHFTLIFQSSHKLMEHHALLSAAEQQQLADRRLAFVREVSTTAPGKVIVMNYPEIGDAVFGSFQNRVPQSFIYQVRRLNMGLMELSAQQPNLFVCDLAELQAKLGRDFCFDANIYISTDMILSLDCLPHVASRVVDIVCAVQGQFKKCLIVDLDNTLWGGIVGDDGWESLQIGHGLGIGKAFTEFQMWVKKLRQRGIIVCVCSKNDLEKAREPFEKHPDMVLHMDDIAVFQANWDTKVDNIRAIQQVLNIGFDQMVFLDDNPFERNMVRENIEGITVPELPDDPALYLEHLYSLNLFETASYSSFDTDRTQQYQIEAQRAQEVHRFANEADFLHSLNMRSVVEGFTTFNTPRVAQLTQRSNQFNLRTVRYTEADIAILASQPDTVCLAFNLNDRFGDNGLVAVVVMKPLDRDTLFVDTWLMSCRVLKRSMEQFTLNTMVAHARQRGYHRIIGEYLPTTKNQMVEHHYTALGFAPLSNSPNARYALDIDTFIPLETYITQQ